MKNKRKRYNKFIMSKEWYGIRDRLFLERGRKCEICGSEDNIHVHHLTYKRFGGNELNEDLQILCKTCHFKLHKKKIPKKSKPIKKKSINKDPYKNILTFYPEVMSKNIPKWEKACIFQKEFGTGRKLYNKNGGYLKNRCKRYCDRIKEVYMERLSITNGCTPPIIAENIYKRIESIYPAIMGLDIDDCDKAYVFKRLFKTKHKLRYKNKKYRRPNCISFLETLEDIYLYRIGINGKVKLKKDNNIDKLVEAILNKK